MSKRWNHPRKDPKLVWCACGHHSTKHEHLGYKKLRGMIVTTVRGRCEVEGCECRRIQWTTRLRLDALIALRARNAARAAAEQAAP